MGALRRRRRRRSAVVDALVLPARGGPIEPAGRVRSAGRVAVVTTLAAAMALSSLAPATAASDPPRDRPAVGTDAAPTGFATPARVAATAVDPTKADRRAPAGTVARPRPSSDATAAAKPEPPPNAALAAFFDREYRLSLEEHPEAATYDGVHDFDDRFTDFGPAAIARRRAHRGEAIATLERFDAAALNTQDAMSRDLMLDQLRLDREVDGLYGPLPFEGLDGWTRISPRGGPPQSLVALAKAMPFATTGDYERYLKRLAAFPGLLDQAAATMREGMRTGWMPPRAVLSQTSAAFEPFVAADPAASPLYRPFEAFPETVPPADRARLEAEGRRMLSDRVTPAIVAFRRFVVDDYLPACRTSLAASDLPGGAAYYALAVRAASTTTLTPRAIHDLGRSEVARIGVAMDALIASLGFTGTRTAFFDRIRDDPRFYYTKPDDMLRDYRDLAKRVDAQLPALFATLPRLPYGVRAMEAYEGDSAEHYTPGALDGSRAGYFEANVLSLATRPRYDMENTFLHEAVPGHHLQIARAAELTGLPAFRRRATIVAYVEGWALYAESLGPQLGAYTDPYSRFSALSWEMVRACRLVLDTGLHAFGWTRDQAIAYLMDNAGLQRGFAAAEVDRYVATPGQATGYKLGQLKIVELRDRARAALDDRFDLRAFHDAILDDGALPLTLLDARIDRWIAERRAAPTAR